MLDTMLPALSSFGGEIDSLIHLIYGVTGFFFVALQAYLVWLLVRNRSRAGVAARHEDGESFRQYGWVLGLGLVVLGLDLFIDSRSAHAWKTVKEDLPRPDLTVRVEAQQFQWVFVYAGPDAAFGTADDVTVSHDLHLPVGKKTLLLLRSKDVIHGFFVPAARLKQDILPGREIPAWLEMTAEGTTPIVCSQLCGFGHTVMGGDVVAESPAAFEAFLRKGKS